MEIELNLNEYYLPDPALWSGPSEKDIIRSWSDQRSIATTATATLKTLQIASGNLLLIKHIQLLNLSLLTSDYGVTGTNALQLNIFVNKVIYYRLYGQTIFHPFPLYLYIPAGLIEFKFLNSTVNDLVISTMVNCWEKVRKANE